VRPELADPRANGSHAHEPKQQENGQEGGNRKGDDRHLVHNSRPRQEDAMNRMLSAAIVSSALALAPPSTASAQLSNKDAPVVVGHFHLNVTSVEAHKKFWVDALGGTATKWGPDNLDVIKFPDTLIFLRVQAPTGPSKGTAFDHIGFAVPNVRDVVAKVRANGFQTTNGREPKPGQTVSPQAAGTPEEIAGVAYVLGPDGAKVELVTNRDANPPSIKYHHVHFINKQYVEMQQWYMKAFDATLRPGQTDFFIGADLPGVGYSLNFFRWEGDQAVSHVGTTGRVVDHVGFDVKNLEAFCQSLEAKGIKLAQPYRKTSPLGNIATAFMTDPWGVSIELTEGLR
jgi:catechol 2,3-dioxygenase-like lactoylglutathione lyase family enzyme